MHLSFKTTTDNNFTHTHTHTHAHNFDHQNNSIIPAKNDYIFKTWNIYIKKTAMLEKIYKDTNIGFF